MLLTKILTETAGEFAFCVKMDSNFFKETILYYRKIAKTNLIQFCKLPLAKISTF